MELLIICRISRDANAVGKIFTLYEITADSAQGGVDIFVD
jgi:hypothetical protein